jgi:RNA polymerase sigma-70 factor, ECF subfamily
MSRSAARPRYGLPATLAQTFLLSIDPRMQPPAPSHEDRISPPRGHDAKKGRQPMQSATTIMARSIRNEGNNRVELNRSTGAGRGKPAGTPPDEELIARVRWREEPALATIYDRYSRLIYMIALRIVGDRELAEEVVQDVFQAVWQSAGSFRPTGNFSAWLIGIARHRAIDATRSRPHRARAREELLDDERMAGHGGASAGEADVLMLRAVVRAALAELPASQRQAIELGYYGGLTQTEIAAQLGEPIGTVKSRMRMGLIKLRELLKTLEE